MTDRVRSAALVVGALLAVSAVAPHPAAAQTWVQQWADEFGGSGGVNTANWLYDIGTSYPGGAARWGTNEVETMTNSTNNVFQSGGFLNIRAIHTGSDPIAGWTSGRIETQRTDFRAPAGGQMAVEARLQLPNVTGAAAQGYWPAFWMLGAPFRGVYTNWPSVGEIDIMENVNGANTVWATLHCGTSPGGPCNETSGIGGNLSGFSPSLQAGFHVYRMEFDRSVSPEEIRFYIDGTEFHVVTANQVDATTWNNATNHGFFIILNLAIGGDWAGAPTASTAASGTFLIDYVRVFYAGGAATATPTNTPRPTATPRATATPRTTPTPRTTATPAGGPLTRVRFFPRSGFANRMLNGVFQGSNTSATSGYTTLFTITNPPLSGWNDLSFNNGTTYRWLRYLGPDGGYGNVAELEFYNGTTRMTGAGFGTAGSWNNGGNTFDRALDGNTSTYFDGPTANGVYAGIDRGGAATATPPPTATPTNTPRPTATPTPSGGGRDAYATIQAESYNAQAGTQLETTSDTGGGQNVGFIANGDWLRYDNVSFGSSTPITVQARVASGIAGGASGLVEFRLGSTTGTLLGSFALANTGGWQSWRTVPTNVVNVTGTQTVFVVFKSGQAADFVNFNWFVFTR